MKFHPLDRTSPARIIILGLLLFIAAGTVLLMLPISTNDSQGAPLISALFTAVSATCVTGLVVQDTAMYWSTFGHLVILTMIQVGGLGVITVGIALSTLSGRKIGLKQRWVMQESISAPQVGGIIRQTRFILTATLLIEVTGAVLLATRFCPEFGFFTGIWYAVFHSISAFCNAGFDLMGVKGTAFSSLTSYQADPVVQLTICSLIIVGGLGFLTWQDLRVNRFHFHAYRLQTKLILTTTACLLVSGFLFLFFFEMKREPWAGFSLGERVLASIFQSTTARTAGFNTIDLAAMSESSCFITIVLMVVGGSPGSTAGGFKTTTLAVLLLSSRAVFLRRTSAECFDRRITDDTLQRAGSIFVLYLVLFLSGGLIIAGVDGVPLLAAMFETASAIGTVGLTLGITTQLSTVSHLVLIVLMCFGRIGGLTMIYAVARSTPGVSQFPQERISVG